MYVKRKALKTLSFVSLLFLSACTKSPEAALSTPESAGQTASKGAVSAVTVTDTACYYVPLPGAFRMFCPGPRDSEQFCKNPGGSRVSYEAAGGSGVESRSAAVRALSSAEAAVLPNQCVSFDLNVLPNASYKLSYTVGQNKFQVFTYLPFGDGSIPGE
jgi:hypothetical protein